MTALSDLQDAVESYTTNDDSDFVTMIPSFIRSAEERIWYFVQLPFFRKASTGNMTSGNAYLQLPEDFLAPASLATISGAGAYTYLINVDVEYIREVYPNPSSTGAPAHYALFDADEDDTTILIGPTPDASYNVQLNYFYRPASLVDQPDGTWLSEHANDTLLYGTLSEASNWMKKVQGIDAMGDTYEQRFQMGLLTLKNLGESRNRKDTYRNGEKRQGER